jgi:hypothetical protein
MIGIPRRLPNSDSSGQYDEAWRPHFAMVGGLVDSTRTQRVPLNPGYNALGER